MEQSGVRELPKGLAEQYALWVSGIDYEIDFWSNWAATRGSAWPEDFAARMSPDKPLARWILDEIGRQGLSQARILDVGAGPITSIGYVPPPNLAVEIVATDALAEAYDRIFDRAGLVRPLPSIFATAEDLSAYLPPASFDIVHCSNALDHSFDPMRGIVEMLRMVRPGGSVMLFHMPNEAEAEGYSGFHQYNFEIRDGRFVIWRGETVLDVARELPVAAEIRCSQKGNVAVTLRRTGEFPPEPEGRFRQRFAEANAAWISLMIRQRMG